MSSGTSVTPFRAHQGCCGAPTLLSDVDAEVPGDATQPGCVSLTHRAELPFSPIAVQFAEHHGGLGGGVLAQIVPRELDAVGAVEDPDEGVADLAEGLRAGVGVVDGHREDDLV